MPRSGSTLIEQIFASHPQVAGLGEVDDFAKAISAAAKGLESPEGFAQLSAAQLRQIGQTYLTGIKAAAPGAARITDKMLENFRFIGLIYLALPNARIIHMRRNPMDICVSCFSKLFTGDNLPFTYNLSELGRYYKAYDSLMAHWREVLPPGAMLELQYEHVVADIEVQTRKILAYCGLEWDPRCLDFHKTERLVHTASKAQVRQPLFNSSVGRWKIYEPFLGPLLKEIEPLM